MIDFIFVFIKYMSTENSKSSFKKFRVYQKGTDICSNNAEFEKKIKYSYCSKSKLSH